MRYAAWTQLRKVFRFLMPASRVQDQVAVCVPRERAEEFGEAKVVTDCHSNAHAAAAEGARCAPRLEAVANLGARAHVAQVHLVVREHEGAGWIHDSLADGDAASHRASQEAEADVSADLACQPAEEIDRLAVISFRVRIELGEHGVIVSSGTELREHKEVVIRIGSNKSRSTLAVGLGLTRDGRDLESKHTQRWRDRGSQQSDARGGRHFFAAVGASAAKEVAISLLPVSATNLRFS